MDRVLWHNKKLVLAKTVINLVNGAQKRSVLFDKTSLEKIIEIPVCSISTSNREVLLIQTDYEKAQFGVLKY